MRCRNCKHTFERTKPMQVVCSLPCAITYGIAKSARIKAHQDRVETQETRKQREKIKPRKEWMKEALEAFCAWIRKRDEGLPCISCGRHAGQRHGGHYRDTFHYAALAFESDNCHAQCAQCNAPPPMGRGGNLINYRAGLMARIGEDRVRELEGHQPVKKYTIDDLHVIRDDYRKRLKGI